MGKQIVSTCIAVLWLSFIISCSSPEENKERHYLKALEYIEHEEPKAAIIELRNAIQIDPLYAIARYQLGLLYFEDGSPQDAFEEMVRVANLDPSNLDANLKAAEFYLITMQKLESRKLIVRILEQDPHNVNGLALLANLELVEGNYDEALKAIKIIGPEIESSDRFQNIKGRIYAAQKKWDEAELAFERAIEINSDSINNYQTLFSIYKGRNEVEKADDLLERMVKRFPEKSEIYMLSADFYLAQNKKHQGEAALLKAISVDPNIVWYRLVLADFYSSIGSFNEAVESLHKASMVIPDNIDIEVALSLIYFREKKFDESRELLDKATTQSEDHKGVRLLEICFMLNDGDYKLGIQELERLNRDYPKWADPYFYKGLAHFYLGEIEMADQSVVRALELSPRNYQYHTMMAQLSQIQGNYEQAEKELIIALKLNPNSFQAALLLGRALIGSKKYSEAIRILSEMKVQAPDNTEIMSYLALAYVKNNDLVEAEKTLVKLLTIDAGNINAIRLLLDLKFHTDLSGAQRYMEERITIVPEESGLYMLLSDILIKQQKYKKALSTLEKAQKLDQDNMQVYLQSGRLLVMMGKKDEAMNKFQAMVEEQPDSIVGYMNIASLFEAEGKSLEAMDVYRKVLDIQGDYVPAANNLAWHIASSPDGDLGEALMLAMMAKQVFPGDPHIADTLGWVHYIRKSYNLAIPQFEMALAGRPDDPVISYHLALAYAGNDENEKAIELLEQILEKGVLFAENDAAAELLAMLKQE